MTKVLLFDFWGTLVENGVRSPIKQVKEILKINLPFSEYVVRMQNVMMTKDYESLSQAFRDVCAEFDRDCNEQVIEDLVGMWNKAWMLAEPYQEVAEELKRLRQDYKIVLVSNTDCFSIDKVMDKFSLHELFDEVFFSYQVRSIKTDKQFFMHVLDQLNLDSKECVMIGDSIQSDIIPAKRLGMKAVLMDRRDTRDYPLKVKSLKDLKQILSL